MVVVSPRQLTQIIDDLEKVIWTKYETYKRVKTYIKRCQEYSGPFDDECNFHIFY